MATYGNSVYQYENPTQVDISMLGKAVQFKQDNYDANTLNVQNLVTQYLNMDLARDIDKNYLGERLQTLVNYVNGSGQKDWSRANIARDVSNYIGNALDDNVARAVASTKMYRKQQADLEALRTKNPELYNQANEWKATQDWGRYLSSNQLGDMYRPQTYTNYVDVSKRVMEMAPKLLKDFGVQMVYQEEMGSTPMFKRVGKHEVITGEEAKKFTNMVLGDDGRMQLAINSQFKNQTIPTEEVASVYNKYIENKIDILTKQKNSYIANKGGASEADKKVIDYNTSQIDDMISDLRTTGKTQTDRDSMLFNMELDNFTSGWGDLLSYDKTVSIDIDDSGYKIAKFNMDVQQQKFDNQMAVDKFNQGSYEFEKTYQLNLAKAMGDGSVSLDPVTGMPIANTSGVNNGIVTTQTPTETEDEQVFNINNIESEYTGAYKIAYDAVKADMADPERRKKLEKEFGSLEGANVSQIVANFVNREGLGKAQAKLANATRKGLFSDSTLTALRATQEKYVPMESMNTELKSLDTEIAHLTSNAIRTMKGTNMYGMSNYHVDKDGNFKTGNEYLSSKKQYSDYNNFEKVGAKLNTILMLEREGGLNADKMSYLKALKRRYLAQLPGNQRLIANETLTYEGDSWTIVNTTKQDFQRIGRWYNNLIGDTEAVKENDKNLEKLYRQNQRIKRDEDAGLNDIMSRNYDFNDIGTKNKMQLKLNGNIVSPSTYINNRVNPIINNMDNIAQGYRQNRLANNTINVDTSIKGNEYITSTVKALMPDSEVIKGTNVAFNIGANGTATMTATVKDGKETALKTIDIPLNSIPPKLLSNINTTESNFAYDANGLKMGYSWSNEILPTKKKVLEEYGDNIADPFQQGIYSKEDILDVMERTYGKKFIDANKKTVDEILNKEIKMDAKLVNGTYVMDISSGEFSERRSLNTSNLGQQIDLITQQKEKMSSEFVVRNLNSVLNKLKN